MYCYKIAQIWLLLDVDIFVIPHGRTKYLQESSRYYAGIAIFAHGTEMAGTVRLFRKENAYEKNA